MASIAPLLVEIAREFGVSVGAAGQVRTASAATAVLMSFFVGGLLGRIGVRQTIVVGGLLAAAGAGLSAAAPSYELLLAAQCLSGAGIAALLSSGLAGADAYFEDADRNWAVGLVIGLQSLAWIIGLPLVGILADAYSWRASLIGVTTIFGFLAAGSAALMLPQLKGRPTSSRGGLMTALRARASRRWAIAELLAFATWTTEITYIGAFYIETYEISETLTGIILPTGSVTFLIGSGVAHRAAIRWPRKQVLLLSALAMGVIALILFNYAPAVVFTMVLGSGMGMVAGMRAAASSTLALDQLPGSAGAITAARTAAAQFGYLIGAAIGGFALTRFGYDALGWIMIVGMTLSAAAMVLVNDPIPEPHKDDRMMTAVVD